jgi:hypothetical protein
MKSFVVAFFETSSTFLNAVINWLDTYEVIASRRIEGSSR